MVEASPADVKPGSPARQRPNADPEAVSAVLGANPFVGLTPEQVARALGRWAAALGRHPTVLAAEVLQWSSDELRVLAGASPLATDAKDRRFADPAWRSPVWRRVAQSYLATRAAVLRSVDELGLDPKSAERARFALTQLTEAMAPTNSLVGNPSAMKRAWQSRGRSLVAGGRHLAYDIRHNSGMPSQVDTRPFRVGETIGVSPGAVVHRSEVFELLQYEPTTPTVGTIPTLVIPPQINRFYFLDMSPGRSFVEYCVARGVPMFMMSWRNPAPEHRAWGLDTYADACLEAMKVAVDILRTDKTNVIGFCSGGMTEAALLSHLAQTDADLVNAAGMAVSLVDTQVQSSLNVFMTERTVRSSLAKSSRKGVLDGRSLGRVFSWMRPNDLVWNYWVANYLMGENPPAFDVLAWNADTTNLSAALHADFLRIWQDNAMMKSDAITVLGSPLDLSAVKNDMYVVGAASDHLVPWESAYAATQTLGGNVRFVLSRSGHIQALVNPPGNPKASFFLNEVNAADPREWLDNAVSVQGSWWEDWASWVRERSGPSRTRPKTLGNRRHPPLDPAPGRYVHDR
jgi:polyhydroxyalkanoate synthase